MAINYNYIISLVYAHIQFAWYFHIESEFSHIIRIQQNVKNWFLFTYLHMCDEKKKDASVALL